MQKEIENWIEQAKCDLAAARNSLKSKNFDWACFQSQQAAEKVLKACYLQKFNALKKVHDLLFLGKELDLPESLLTSCVKLSRVCIETRYPSLDEEIPAKLFGFNEAETAINLAEGILQWAEKQL